MKLTILVLIFCGLALFLLSVRVIFSRSHKFLTGHACKGMPRERYPLERKKEPTDAIKQ